MKLGGRSGSANGLEPELTFLIHQLSSVLQNMLIATQTTNHPIYFDFQTWALKMNRAMT